MNSVSFRDTINPKCSPFVCRPVSKDYFHNETYVNVSTLGSGKTFDNNKAFVPDKVFLENKEPSLEVLNVGNMSPLNFNCKSTPTYNYLNNLGTDPSPYFRKTDSGYTSIKSDGRLLDARHNYNMQVGEVPTQVVYNMMNDNVSGNPDLKNYGRGYTGYESVNAGDIRYYIDNDLAEPFFNPVYGMKSKSVGIEYKNPMDNLVPAYNKEYSTDLLEDGLSFINDRVKFVDDITSRQQRIHNSQKYELMHKSNLSKQKTPPK